MHLYSNELLLIKKYSQFYYHYYNLNGYLKVYNNKHNFIIFIIMIIYLIIILHFILSYIEL